MALPGCKMHTTARRSQNPHLCPSLMVASTSFTNMLLQTLHGQLSSEKWGMKGEWIPYASWKRIRSCSWCSLKPDPDKLAAVLGMTGCARRVRDTVMHWCKHNLWWPWASVCCASWVPESSQGCKWVLWVREIFQQLWARGNDDVIRHLGGAGAVRYW